MAIVGAAPAAFGIFPTYDQAARPTEAELDRHLDRVRRETAGDGHGYVFHYMPETGGRPEIGILPKWAVLDILTDGDPRARDANVLMARTSRLWPAHVIDPGTGRFLSIDDRPLVNLSGSVTYDPKQNWPHPPGKPGLSPDISHHPAFAFHACMVTGDVHLLEEVQAWAVYCLAWGNPEYRLNSQGLMKWEQIRGQAWALRSIAHAMVATPEGPLPKPLLPRSYFAEKLFNNLTYMTAQQRPGGAYDNGMGLFRGALARNPAYEGQIAPWQNGFFVGVLGHLLIDLGIEAARELFGITARFHIDCLLDDRYWQYSSLYNMNITAADGSIVPSVRAMFERSDTRAVLKPGAMSGSGTAEGRDGVGHDEGYPCNLQPALAYAAAAGLPGAAAAWARFMGRTFKPAYRDGPSVPADPVWAVVPAGANPAPDPGPSPGPDPGPAPDPDPAPEPDPQPQPDPEPVMPLTFKSPVVLVDATGREFTVSAFAAPPAPTPEPDPQPQPDPVPTVARLVLVDAVTGQARAALADGMTLAAADAAGVNICAEAADVGSIAFVLDGATMRLENAAPWCAWGDDGNVTLPAGAHVIEAMPYAGANATGAPGPVHRVAFTVAAAAPAPQPDPAPEPEPGPEPQPIPDPAPDDWPLAALARRGPGWHRVPMNNKFMDVQAKAAGHPAWGTEGPVAKVTKWCGAAYFNRKHLIVGGGHNDSGDNSATVADYMDLLWKQRTQPSRYKPDAHAKASGETLDGAWPSCHTYDGIVALPERDGVMVFGGAVYSAGGGGYPGAWFYDDVKAAAGAMPWTRLEDCIGSWMASDRDPATGVILLTGYRSIELRDPATGARIGVSGQSWTQGDVAGAWDFGRRHFCALHEGAGHLLLWDLSQVDIRTEKRPPGSQVARMVNADRSLFTLPRPYNRYGMVFHPPTQSFVLWAGDAELIRLDYAGWSAKPVAGGSPRHEFFATRMPYPGGPAHYGKTAGVYSRWEWIAELDVFIGWNDPYDDPWLFVPMAPAANPLPTPGAGTA